MRLIWITADRSADQEVEFQRQFRDSTIETAATAFEGIERLAAGAFDVAVVTFPLPDWTAEDFLEEVQRVNAFLPVIIHDPKGDMSDAIRAVKLGAYHFFGDGSSLAGMGPVIEAAVEYRRSRELALFGAAISQEPWRKYLIGDS